MIKGIRYYSLYGQCGYADAAISYIKGLRASGIPVRWSPIVGTRWGYAPWEILPDDMRPDTDEIEQSLADGTQMLECLKSDVEYDTVVLHCTPEVWPKLIEPEKINIGYTVWETDHLPGHWPELLRQVDHLCVPCKYNQALFSMPGGPVVTIVPHTIRQPSKVHPDQERCDFKHEHEIDEEAYIFYIVAAWIPRKAMFETIHAYLQAFEGNEKVCLLIKTDDVAEIDFSNGVRGDVRNVIEGIISNYSNPAQVAIIAGRIAESKIDMIHEVGDCFFSLTHCEGWGLGAFDAAIAGNPVIITGWGGQTDYLPAEYSYHVKFVLKNVVEVMNWDSYNRHHQWAFADMDDAMNLLRYVFRHRNEAGEKGQYLQGHVNKNFSSQKVSRIFLEAINAAHSC